MRDSGSVRQRAPNEPSRENAGPCRSLGAKHQLNNAAPKCYDVSHGEVNAANLVFKLSKERTETITKCKKGLLSIMRESRRNNYASVLIDLKQDGSKIIKQFKTAFC